MHVNKIEDATSAFRNATSADLSLIYFKDTNPCVKESPNTPPSHQHTTVLLPLHQSLLHVTAHAVSQCSTPSSNGCFIYLHHHFPLKGEGNKRRGWLFGRRWQSKLLNSFVRKNLRRKRVRKLQFV